MLKKILKLEGAQELTRSEQKTIDGGINIECSPTGVCSGSTKCVFDCKPVGVCRPNSYVEKLC
ncbi:hypothetical protein B8T70_14290 [Flavobacterium sp. AJR]|jgi:hypothetical protein|nr:hypothetical protein OA88_01215 [Flavobacterium sp. JRM]OUL61614.1 hypothetical protein B8T70_14290 [Flavobacterium sp. AJR]